MDTMNNNNQKITRDYVALLLQEEHIKCCNHIYNNEINILRDTFFAINKFQKIDRIQKSIDLNNKLLSKVQHKKDLFNNFLTVDDSIVKQYLDDCAGFLLRLTGNEYEPYYLVSYSSLPYHSFPTYFTYLDHVKYIKFIRALVKEQYYITDVDYKYSPDINIDIMGNSSKSGKMTTLLNSLDEDFLKDFIKSNNYTISMSFSNNNDDNFTIHNSGIIMADNFDKELCNKVVKDLNK